jgi:hypothetical protein
MRYAVEVPNVVSVARHTLGARQINWLGLIRVIFIRVCTENSNPSIAVVQSTQDSVRT